MISCIDDGLNVACIICVFTKVIPLQRLEVCLEDLDLVFAKLYFGILFGLSNAPIFKRGKHCGGNIYIVHKLLFMIKQAPCQQSSSHDSSWC